MSFTNFDEKKREVVFIDPEAMLLSESKESMINRYPMGELLISFLEFDFSEYDKARNWMIDQFQKNDFTPDKMKEAASWLVKRGIVIDLYNPHKYNPFLLGPLNPLLSSTLVPYQHQYFSSSTPEINEVDAAGTAVEYLQRNDYLGGQAALLKGLRFCLDIDFSTELNQFTADERFLIGYETNRFVPPINIEDIKSGFPADYLCGFIWFVNMSDLDDAVNKEAADFGADFLRQVKESFKQQPFSIMEGYTCKSPLELATLELMKMIKVGMKVRRCANCGKNFIIAREDGPEYCNRKPAGSKRTCQGIGSLKKYKQKVKNSDLFGAYTKAYNRLYSRCKKQRMLPQDEFDAWVKKATWKRDQVIDGKISEAEAIEWFEKA